MTAREFSCPSCGGPLAATLKYSKLVGCDQCGSAVFLEDDAVRLAGEQAAVQDIPSIFQIGNSFDYRGTLLTPYGRLQFDHGDGIWDEWWIVDNQNNAAWFSVDEGDIAREEPLELGNTSPSLSALRLRSTVRIAGDEYIVTELDEGICVGIQGEIPEDITFGEKHHYAHLSRSDGEIVTLEYFEGQIKAYRGKWLDPFDIKTLSGETA